MTALPPGIRRRIRAIERDRVHGAAELTRQAAETLLLLAGEGGRRSTAELLACTEQATQALRRAQPSMASMTNLARVVRRAAASGERHSVSRACRYFLQRLQHNGRLVSRHAAALIAPGEAILTHSFSGTVLEALLLASRRRRRFTVVCTESRPLCEGRRLAARLARAGIATRVVIDAAMVQAASEASLILVGADSVSPEGVVNKIGTTALALAARDNGKTLYALCGTEKFLPFPGNAVPLPEYFDRTPLDQFSGVVAECGKLTPGGIRRLLRRMKKMEQGWEHFP